VGVVGQADPLLVEDLGAAQPIFLLDLDLDRLMESATGGARYRPFSRRPSVWRDLSVVGPESSAAGEWIAAIEQAGRPLLAETGVFDVYRGRGLGAGEVSRSFRLRFSDAERPLTDADVEPALAAIVAALERAGARLRG